MNFKQRKKLWKLYSITNKLGGTADYTAISLRTLMAYKKAHEKVSKVIALIVSNEDEDLCQRYINELEALSRWNFGDKNGKISKEEQDINERITKEMKGWTPFLDI